MLLPGQGFSLFSPILFEVQLDKRFTVVVPGEQFNGPRGFISWFTRERERENSNCLEINKKSTMKILNGRHFNGQLLEILLLVRTDDCSGAYRKELALGISFGDFSAPSTADGAICLGSC